MATKFCIGWSYRDAKCMVQNRTTSNLASDDHEWIGLHGQSIEGANLAVINRRKTPTPAEIEAYQILRPLNSQVLDHVWPEPPAVIAI